MTNWEDGTMPSTWERESGGPTSSLPSSLIRHFQQTITHTPKWATVWASRKMEKTGSSGSRRGQSEREIYERRWLKRKGRKGGEEERSIGLVINLEGGRRRWF